MSLCTDLHEKAREYVDAHPALAGRIGPELAVERVESMLFGLAILGRQGSDLGVLLPRLHPAAHGVRFGNPLSLTWGLCSPYPWAHISLRKGAQLRWAYGAALRDRLALESHPWRSTAPRAGACFPVWRR